MNPEWEELKAKIKLYNEAQTEEILVWMEDIERRHLPERVAEILEKADYQGLAERFMTAAYAIKIWSEETAKALRTGDTTEIEKWCKHD